MRLIAGSVGTLLLLTTTVANSQGFKQDGSELLTYCTNMVKVLDGAKDADYFLAGRCFGLVEATASSLESTGKLCVPDGVAYGDMVRGVTQYLRRNHSQLFQRHTILIQKYFDAEWPCIRK